MKTYRIFGIRLRNLDFAELFREFDRALIAGKKEIFLFAHCHTLNRARQESELHRNLLEADSILGDGLGVRLGALMRKCHRKANLNGTDFIPAYLTRPESPPATYYLIGSSAETIAAAADFARKAFPRHELVGYHSGFFDSEAERALWADLQKRRPSLVLVGMGSPFQEAMIFRTRDIIPNAVFVSVGALFEYWSGRLYRPPARVRKLQLEWLVRSFVQPRLFKRYFWDNMIYIIAAIRTRRADMNQMKND